MPPIGAFVVVPRDDDSAGEHALAGDCREEAARQLEAMVGGPSLNPDCGPGETSTVSGEIIVGPAATLLSIEVPVLGVGAVSGQRPSPE
jgi:hypothetical protein